MAKEVVTFGNIQSGKLNIVERGQFLDSLAAFPDCEIELTVKRLGRQRSSPQSRYYFGVVVPLIRDAMNDALGERLDKEEVHEWLKKEFNSREIETSNGHFLTVALSTRKMNTTDFTDYIERCRNWAATFFGIDIPDPVKLSTTKTELKV
ncbi:hypothetical protein [Spirosoma oryzicola]|uniref:hypothetical protein n=1 Tax=Spirosoma oryzicola TaxID=2898794 RepID=UPI001E5BC29A|nr:hypothetical protein [Spirosoma oryzicola]UHG93218.1 hypothetical protein LQ777_10035 [Spirosoma oryzicola]